MPDPDVSNRERLLRLIDGGPEVLKSIPPAEDIPKPATKAPAGAWKAPLSDASILKLVKLLVLFGVALAGLHYGAEVLKSLPFAAKPVPGSPSSPAEADEAGVGLRLVGVDTSEAPVALLEDLKTGKTYFARKNDRVKDVQVKQILKNKVVVSSHGRSVELR